MEEMQNSMEMYQQILRLWSYTKVTKLTIPNSLTKKGIRQQHKQTVRQNRKQWETWPWGWTPVLCLRAQQGQPSPQRHGSCAQVDHLSFILDDPLRQLQFRHTIFPIFANGRWRGRQALKVSFSEAPPSGLKAAEKPEVLTGNHLSPPESWRRRLVPTSSAYPAHPW